MTQEKTVLAKRKSNNQINHYDSKKMSASHDDGKMIVPNTDLKP